MNKKYLLSITCLLFLSIAILSQSPQTFKYQSVVRDGQGNALANQNVSFKISILQSTSTGSSVYSETQNATTNAFGLANLSIGLGTVVLGNFSSISWESDNFFIQVEMDITGGTAYVVMGSTQLLSVPYALHSKTVEVDNDMQTLTYDSLNGNLTISNGNTVDLSVLQDGVNDADSDPNNEIQVMSFSNDTLYLTNGGYIYLGVYGIDLVNDADSDPNNEIQVISFLNDTLYLTNGGHIYLGAYAIDLVDDADNDPNNEIEFPTSANAGDIMEFDGNSWLPVSPLSSSAAGCVMYIYNGQTCPSGWNTQQIDIAIFGGVPVDACWTDSPCMIMYIYDGQTCPSGWTLQAIGAAVVNGSTTPVDACFKCY